MVYNPSIHIIEKIDNQPKDKIISLLQADLHSDVDQTFLMKTAQGNYLIDWYWKEIGEVDDNRKPFARFAIGNNEDATFSEKIEFLIELLTNPNLLIIKQW